MPGKTKLVMIDDEEDLCIVVKANLEDTGEFEVVTITNPEDAEKTISQEHPDIILMDVVMPGRRGDEIAKSLKKDESTKNIPIILVSGKGEMVYNKKKQEFKWMPNSTIVQTRGELPEGKTAETLSQAYNVNDYVSKPFSTDLLVQVIKEVIALSRKPDEEEEEIIEPGAA